jgi:hypothetical protein
MVSTILVVVGENCRNKDLSCDYPNSIGLKSAEYGDKHKIETPTASIIGLTEASLCAGKLFITTTAPDHNYGTKHFKGKYLKCFAIHRVIHCYECHYSLETNCTN